jgi:hypothetical protein
VCVFLIYIKHATCFVHLILLYLSTNYQATYYAFFSIFLLLSSRGWMCYFNLLSIDVSAYLEILNVICVTVGKLAIHLLFSIQLFCIFYKMWRLKKTWNLFNQNWDQCFAIYYEDRTWPCISKFQRSHCMIMFENLVFYWISIANLSHVLEKCTYWNPESHRLFRHNPALPTKLVVCYNTVSLQWWRIHSLFSCLSYHWLLSHFVCLTIYQ